MTELRRPIAGSGDGTCQRKCKQGANSDQGDGEQWERGRGTRVIARMTDSACNGGTRGRKDVVRFIT